MAVPAHPSVISAGAAVAGGSLGGDTAQCLAMIQALQEALSSYVPSSGGNRDYRRELNVALTREVTWLTSCTGTLAAPMMNTVRWIHRAIEKLETGTTLDECKKLLKDGVDKFSQERFVGARGLVAKNLESWFGDGSVVLVFSFSSVVEESLLKRAEKGAGFRVVVLDAAPARHGRKLAKRLVERGVEVEYGMLAAAQWLLEGASVVVLGAQEIAANGVALTRPGSAGLAIMAKEMNIPLVIAAQTLKFTNEMRLHPPDDRVAAIPAHDIEVIVTEFGNIVPSEAPHVFEKYNEYGHHAHHAQHARHHDHT